MRFSHDPDHIFEHLEVRTSRSLRLLPAGEVGEENGDGDVAPDVGDNAIDLFQAGLIRHRSGGVLGRGRVTAKF